MIDFTTLDSLCISIFDCPHSTPDWKSEGFPVIRNYNIKDGTIDINELSYVDENTYIERTKRAIPEENDIVISREAPMGKVCIIPKNFKCCLGQRLVLLKVNKEICNPLYLLYALSSDFVQKQINRVDLTGSIVSNLNISALKELIIPVIPLSEQDKISECLASLDKKIQNNKKQIETLESLAKTIYDYWFVQFDFPNEDGKPYKSSGGKMVWNEMLKINIPQGWNVCTLEDKVEFEKGISYSSDSISTNDGTPMINLANIGINKNYKKDGLKFFNEKVDESKLVIGGDLLIACTDLTKKADIIGCPVTVPYDSLKYVYSTDIAKLNVTTDLIDPLFLYMTLRTDFYHSYIKRWASGTNVIHLNLDGIKLYPVCIPDMKLQKRFSKIEELFLRYVSKLHLINTELEKLRELLLPMLMNGQASLI